MRIPLPAVAAVHGRRASDRDLGSRWLDELHPLARDLAPGGRITVGSGPRSRRPDCVGRAAAPLRHFGAYRLGQLARYLFGRTDRRGPATRRRGGLREPAGRRPALLALVDVTPETMAHPEPRPSWLARVGNATRAAWHSTNRALAFLGEATLAFGRLLLGALGTGDPISTTRFKRLAHDALPIVTLISVLIGMILAFVGGVTLRNFGATIYVADLGRHRAWCASLAPS